MPTTSRVFRDPVHGNIEFSRIREDDWDSLAQDLIETPQVQRLRRVRQLGLAGLVYHGVEHSRFGHTLGVAHLAKRLYMAACQHSGIPIAKEELKGVVASALLHDIGHPPFSHAVENVLEVKHEKVGLRLLRDDTEVHDVLKRHGGDGFIESIAGHIDGSTDAPTVDLISSQLDADRLDYVLRDGYYAGVPNSQYDLERIIQMVSRDDEGFPFDERSQYAIEGYFMARYHLYLQLYYHRTTRAAEAMLRSTIRRASLIAKEGRPHNLGPINPSLFALLKSGAAEAAVRVCDADFWTAFAVWAEDVQDPILRDLSVRLLNRRLFRAIEIQYDSLQQFYKEWLPKAKAIAHAKGFDPNYYVVDDSARDTPYKIADYDLSTSVRIVGRNGRSRPLERLSGIIKALQEEAYQKVRCCLPVEIREDVRAVLR